MGNFKSIEEVERMASIVSDMGKSKLIRKDGPYDMCAAAMENVDEEAYLKIKIENDECIYAKNTFPYMRR